MANHSVNHIVLTPQELTALINVIKLSFEAFKAEDYPIFYDCFLMNIYHMVQLGSAAVTSATPKVSLREFSYEIDQLAGFMREIGTISYYKDRKKL